MTGRITLCFVLFLVAFIYEAETLKKETTRAVHDAIARQSPREQPEINDRRQSAVALVMSNELSYFNEVATRVATKLYPDLKEDLRYSAFKNSLANRRSTRGIMRFEPLEKMFVDDHAALKARYRKDFPSESIPD